MVQATQMKVTDYAHNYTVYSACTAKSLADRLIPADHFHGGFIQQIFDW